MNLNSVSLQQNCVQHKIADSHGRNAAVRTRHSGGRGNYRLYVSGASAVRDKFKAASRSRDNALSRNLHGLQCRKSMTAHVRIYTHKHTHAHFPASAPTTSVCCFPARGSVQRLGQRPEPHTANCGRSGLTRIRVGTCTAVLMYRRTAGYHMARSCAEPQHAAVHCSALCNVSARL